MNDYAQRVLTLLGDRSPLDVLAATPSRLEGLSWELKDKGLGRSYGEGRWTARQIFAHLTDAEIGNAFRIRQVLTEDRHRVQTFDQDAWLGLYKGIDVSLRLEAFRVLRLANLELFRPLSPASCLPVTTSTTSPSSSRSPRHASSARRCSLSATHGPLRETLMPFWSGSCGCELSKSGDDQEGPELGCERGDTRPSVVR